MLEKLIHVVVQLKMGSSPFFSLQCVKLKREQNAEKHSADLPEVDLAQSKTLHSASNYAGISKAVAALKLQ